MLPTVRMSEEPIVTVPNPLELFNPLMVWLAATLNVPLNPRLTDDVLPSDVALSNSASRR